MRKNCLLVLLFLHCLGLGFVSSSAFAQQSVVALNLGPAAAKAPAADSDWQLALTLDRFFRANGRDIPVTPTSVSLLWDSTALYVRFHCADPDPVYREGVRVRRSDQVELGLVPPGGGQQDMWQFDADMSGRTTVRHAGRPAASTAAKITVDAESWTAVFTIPWANVGGEPARPFRLQLSRTRSITGEVLSPGASDFHDGPADTARAPAATDQFLEVALGGAKGATTAGSGLITLPSGVRRWQRRALLHHITMDERRELARLEQDLTARPTTATNLAARVRLAELWYDLYEQEGLSFHYEGGAWALSPGELNPWEARHAFNDALHSGNVSSACAILDSLLRHFTRAARTWFADGTPGDVAGSWSAVTAIRSARLEGSQLVLDAEAAGEPLNLFLSFPATGGIRLHGPDTGFFAPAAEASVDLAQSGDGLRATANGLTVKIVYGTSWRIDLLGEGSTHALWGLGAGDLSLLRGPGGRIASVDLHGDLGPDDRITGLGERFDSLDQRGKTLTLWQTDAWDSTALGGLSNQAYKPIPFWQNTAGYGVFWNSTYEIRADFGYDSSDRYRVTAHGPIFDLYLWTGDTRQVLQQYTALTGRSLLPPAWAFEPWMGGGGDRWAEERWQTATETLLDVVDRFRSLDIPHSAIYAEGDTSFDPLVYRHLVPQGIRVLTWARSQPLGWNIDQIKTALHDPTEDKLPLMRIPDGKGLGFAAPLLPSNQFPYIDFTDPRGLDLYRSFWKERQDLGVAGSMADFSDLVPRDAVFHDGSSGEQMHNWYVHFYDHAIHQIFAERRGDDFIVFARAAAPGTQVDVGQMCGDHASDFRGLDESLAGGLSLSSSGFSNWGSDVGGYFGKGDEEVYLRWIEFGTFSPLMRFHGTEPREPWFYSDAAVATYRKYAWVRENLLPYIYGSAQVTHTQGVPLMRILPQYASDEYMFGDDLLVAPVHAPGEHRSLMLPPGRWTDFWTGAPVESGASMRVASIDDIPVFLRAGALVPVELAPSLTLGDSMSAGRVGALMITPPDASPTVRHWDLPGHSEVIDLRSTPDAAGFVISTAHWYDLQYLVVSGVQSMKGVSVDGAPLTELGGAESKSLPPGWKKLNDHQYLVRLPNAANHEIHIAAE